MNAPRATAHPEARCHACSTPGLVGVPGYGNLSRLTSDSKPWPRGGRLCICPACGCVQKPIDREWEEEARAIYDAYSIYRLAGGAEQAVFEESSGKPHARSARLLERLLARAELPESGRLLDLGCGNGALLRAFSSLRPAWALEGTELNDKYRTVVEAIPGVVGFHTGAPDLIPGRFDLITMVHVLEHVTGPVAFLAQLREKLVPGGLLMVEVPDYLVNPFDLLIADHSSHFSADTLSDVVRRAGFDLLYAGTGWVPKELTLLARKSAGQSRQPARPAFPGQEVVAARVEWLAEVAAAARAMAEGGCFGIFGSSNAATWMHAEVGGRAEFFVDEDARCAGRAYLDLPVYLPRDIPEGGRVYLALAPSVARDVRERLQAACPGREFCSPPDLPDALT